jgi:hypothetical protein
MTDERGSDDAEEQMAREGDVAAIVAACSYEPKTDGERVVVEAVCALSRAVVRLDHRLNQGFIDLRGHVDKVTEEWRGGVEIATVAKDKLVASADAFQELVKMVKGLDAFVRGIPSDRESSPETPASKYRASVAPPPIEGAVTVNDP